MKSLPRRLKLSKSRVFQVILILLLFGIDFYFHSYHRVDDEHALAHYNDSKQSVTIEGVVSEAPDERPEQMKLTVSAEKIVLKGKELTVDGHVLMNIPLFPHFAYGDRVKLTGMLETPFETDEFSYKDYLAAQGIHSVMKRPRIYKIGHEGLNPVYGDLIGVRNFLEDRINTVFSEPDASLMAGLLIGSRRGIPEDIMNDFTTTGLTHIIAISGYNITLIVTILFALLKGLSSRTRIIITLVFIVLFTILVGAQASVVRAAVMGIVMLVGLSLRRPTQITTTLLLSALIMAIWNPLVLRDIGFQLSFGATAGLVYLSPLLKPLFDRIKIPLIPEMLCLTLSAQLATLPIIWHSFGRVSLISLISNLVIPPIIPLIMFAGSVALILPWVSIIPHFLMGYLLNMNHLLALIPYASLSFPKGPIWAVFLMYGALFAAYHLIPTYATLETDRS